MQFLHGSQLWLPISAANPPTESLQFHMNYRVTVWEWEPGTETEVVSDGTAKG